MMKFGGLFGSRVFSGYKCDVMKSGIQKYLRRRERSKMLRCMIELDKFSEFGNKSKGIRSNMMNRIIVMCFEEICFCEVDNVVKIMKEIDLWEESGRENKKCLVNICNIMVSSEIIRLGSDIKNYFGEGVRKFDIGLDWIDRDKSNVDMEKVEKYKKNRDNEDILSDMSKFIECMEKKNDSMFYWMFEILNKSKEGVKGGLRWRRKDCEYIIWEYLYDMVDNVKIKEYLDYALKEYFKKNRMMKGDRFLFLINSILVIKNKNRLNLDSNFDCNVSDEEVEELYNLKEKFVVDDYVIDIHTGVGRSKGKNGIDFMNDGSFVVNENKEWYVDEYRKGYRYMKKVKEVEKKKEDIEFIKWDNFENISVLEEGVCGGKVCCIRVKYKGEEYVIKEMGKSMNFGKDYVFMDELKPLFGLNSLEMKRIKSNVGLLKKDVKIKNYIGNWVLGEKDVIYSMMKYMENDGDVGKNKEVYEDKELLSEIIKVRLYDGLFRSSDNNMRNILVNKSLKKFIVLMKEMFMGKERKYLIKMKINGVGNI